MNPADLFRQDSNPVTLAAGDALFKAGEVGSEMFVLVDGTVDILVGGKVVETAHAGALLGEMAMIESAPRSASGASISSCSKTPSSPRM